MKFNFNRSEKGNPRLKELKSTGGTVERNLLPGNENLDDEPREGMGIENGVYPSPEDQMIAQEEAREREEIVGTRGPEYEGADTYEEPISVTRGGVSIPLEEAVRKAEGIKRTKEELEDDVNMVQTGPEEIDPIPDVSDPAEEIPVRIKSTKVRSPEKKYDPHTPRHKTPGTDSIRPSL